MKRFALLFLLLTAPIFGQTTQEKCQQNACYGYGAPSGSCAGAFIYSDISQTPVQAYSCVNQAWAKAGGASSIPNVNTAGLLNLTLFDAADYSGGSGTTAHDKSGSGNNCTITLGSNLTWDTVGGAYALNFGGIQNSTQWINCPTITSPQTVILILKGSPTIGGSNPGTSFQPLAGYSQTNGFSIVTYNSLYTPSGGVPNYAIEVGQGLYYGTVTGAYLPSGYNMLSFVVSSNAANNATYQNLLSVPFMDSQTGYANASSSGNLIVGGTAAGGFTGGLASQGISIIGYAVYSTSVSVQVIQQDFSAISSYYNALGVDIAGFTPYLTASQQFNVIDSGSSIDAGNLSKAPSSYMTLGANYTVNNTAISANATITRREAQANLEHFYFNSIAGRNIYLMGGPTNDLCEIPSYVDGGNSTPMQAWANILAWVNYVHSFDPQGLAMVKTMISRTGSAQSPNTGTCDAIKDVVNTIIRNNIGAVPNAALADIAAIPVLGADGANSGTPGTIEACPGATTYFNADCTHPTPAGSALYGSEEQSAIMANTGYSDTSPNIQFSTYSMTAADRSLNETITANTTVNLPDCLGLTGYGYRITNTLAGGSYTLTMAPINSETISGTATISAGASGVFRATLIGATTGGCYWLRAQ